MVDRILILSASAGAGHVKAGQALLAAFRSLPPRIQDDKEIAREVLHVDALDYASPMLRWSYARGYIHCVRYAPEVFRKLYETLDNPFDLDSYLDSFRVKLEFLQSRRLIQFIEEFAPSAILVTHFLPAALVSNLKRRQRLNSYLGVVVTDFDVHATWLVSDYDNYFVANQSTADYLDCLGFGERTVVTGIPIDPVFANTKAVIPLQQKFGLLPGLPTVLVSAGAFCLVPIEQTIKELLEAKPRLQVIALCGKDEELRRRVEQLEPHNSVAGSGAAGNGIKRLHVFGFVDNMDELMACSDVIVSKPGGLTVSEALAKNVIFGVVHPIPGQEERNADFLLEHGAGIKCNSEYSLARRITSLLSDHERCAAMRRNISTLARPLAAESIARHVLGMSTMRYENQHGESESPFSINALASIEEVDSCHEKR